LDYKELEETTETVVEEKDQKIVPLLIIGSALICFVTTLVLALKCYKKSPEQKDLPLKDLITIDVEKTPEIKPQSMKVDVDLIKVGQIQGEAPDTLLQIDPIDIPTDLDHIIIEITNPPKIVTEINKAA
jgi:hypothetical protein